MKEEEKKALECNQDYVRFSKGEKEISPLFSPILTLILITMML
jgi:hypothetical protein